MFPLNSFTLIKYPIDMTTSHDCIACMALVSDYDTSLSSLSDTDEDQFNEGEN